MNLLRIAATAALLSGCSTPEERGREALMDQIEKQVQLPKGARPLSEYARYYAETGKSEVHAVYLIPISGELGPGEGCSELTENFSLKDVPCEPTADFPGLAPGERKWVADEDELPFMMDGGCMQVTVVFDKAKSVIRSAHCNGVA